MKVDSAFIARWYENYESFIYKHAYMPINLDTKDIVMVLPYCDSVNKVDIKESTYGIVVSAKRTWEEGSKDSLVAAIEGWGYEEWVDGGTVSVLIKYPRLKHVGLSKRKERRFKSINNN